MPKIEAVTLDEAWKAQLTPLVNRTEIAVSKVRSITRPSDLERDQYATLRSDVETLVKDWANLCDHFAESTGLPSTEFPAFLDQRALEQGYLIHHLHYQMRVRQWVKMAKNLTTTGAGVANHFLGDGLTSLLLEHRLYRDLVHVSERDSAFIESGFGFGEHMDLVTTARKMLIPTYGHPRDHGHEPPSVSEIEDAARWVERLWGRPEYNTLQAREQDEDLDALLGAPQEYCDTKEVDPIGQDKAPDSVSVRLLKEEVRSMTDKLRFLNQLGGIDKAISQYEQSAYDRRMAAYMEGRVSHLDPSVAEQADTSRSRENGQYTGVRVGERAWPPEPTKTPSKPKGLAKESFTEECPDETLYEKIHSDADTAAWRVAAKQLSLGIRDPMAALIARATGTDFSMASLLMQTQVGEALVAGILSLGLPHIPGLLSDDKKVRLARELRVHAMTEAGDMAAEMLLGPLRESLAEMLKDGINLPDVLPVPAVRELPSATVALTTTIPDLSKETT